MRLSGQFQACLSFLRKNFKLKKMQIKQKPTNKTKNRQTKNNKGDGFSCKKTSKRGESFVLGFLKKLKLS